MRRVSAERTKQPESLWAAGFAPGSGGLQGRGFLTIVEVSTDSASRSRIFD
jgi:hypothetical protein